MRPYWKLLNDNQNLMRQFLSRAIEGILKLLWVSSTQSLGPRYDWLCSATDPHFNNSQLSFSHLLRELVPG